VVGAFVGAVVKWLMERKEKAELRYSFANLEAMS